MIYPGWDRAHPLPALRNRHRCATAILLADHPGVTFDIETPAGDDDTRSSGRAGRNVRGRHQHELLPLHAPLALGANPAQEGTWYAVLQYRHKPGGQGDRAAAASGGAIRYSFSGPRVHQPADAGSSGFTEQPLEPGATLTITATLSEYGVPVAGRATVLAEIERPDGSSFTLALPEVGDGRFQPYRGRTSRRLPNPPDGSLR